MYPAAVIIREIYVIIEVHDPSQRRCLSTTSHTSYPKRRHSTQLSHMSFTKCLNLPKLWSARL